MNSGRRRVIENVKSVLVAWSNGFPSLKRRGGCAINKMAPFLLKAQTGWSLTRYVAERIFDTSRVSDHPGRAAKVASQHFIDGASTPPFQGVHYVEKRPVSGLALSKTEPNLLKGDWPIMVNHIFVGIDLGDKNSVARIAVNRDKTERWGFVNDCRGRARLFEELKRRAGNMAEAQIVMAYEASSCGFILCEEAEGRGIQCWVVAPTKMEKSVEQRKHKNDDRDAEDLVEKLRGHVLAGNRLPKVWIPDRQIRDDRELIRTRTELVEKQTRLKTQIQMLVKRHGLEKPAGCEIGRASCRERG